MKKRYNYKLLRLDLDLKPVTQWENSLMEAIDIEGKQHKYKLVLGWLSILRIVLLKLNVHILFWA